MKRRFSRERSCEGKVAYASWTAASHVADKMAREKDEHLVPYRCRYCQKWKLGHPPTDGALSVARPPRTGPGGLRGGYALAIPTVLEMTH